MTFAELKAAALGDNFNTTTKAAAAGRYINRAMKIVARRIGVANTEAKATATTNVGEDTYDLPADFSHFTGAGNPVWLDNEPLEQIDRADIEDRGPASGKPISFTQYEGNIIFWPTPDGEYDLTLFYRAGPLTMVDDLEEPTLPDDYHELLPIYARARLYGDEDDEQAMTTWLGMFESELRQTHRDDGARAAFHRRVPGMWNRRTTPMFRIPS